MTVAARSSDMNPAMPVYGDVRTIGRGKRRWRCTRPPSTICCSRRRPSTAEHFDPNRVQLSRLLSIKTGGCPEDCGYCSQSSHHRFRPQGLQADGSRARRRRGAQGARRRRHPLLHGRGMAQSEGARHGRHRRHGRGRQGAGHGDLHDARHARPRAGRAARHRPVSTTTTTISIPPSATTARSSPRAPSPTAWIRSHMSATPASRSAAAASSAWAKRRSTASTCW